MIAACHHISARVDKICANRFSDAKAACCVLAVNYDKIESVCLAQARQLVANCVAPRAPNDITQKQYAHVLFFSSFLR
jgi:hypothetical protein